MTPAMDVYSLAVALYALVCGRFPFDGATVEELARSRASAQPPSPRQYRQDLPPSVAAIMVKALAESSKDGFATAGALAGAFTAALEDATGEKAVAFPSTQGALARTLSRSIPSSPSRGAPDAPSAAPPAQPSPPAGRWRWRGRRGDRGV